MQLRGLSCQALAQPEPDSHTNAWEQVGRPAAEVPGSQQGHPASQHAQKRPVLIKTSL